MSGLGTETRTLRLLALAMTLGALAMGIAGCGSEFTNPASPIASNATSAASAAPGSPSRSVTVVPSPSPSGSPALSPSSAPTATIAPTAAPSVGRLRLGTLAAGTYASSLLRPRLTLTIRAGFGLRAEAADYVWLSVGSGRRAPEIAVMRVARAGVIDALVGRAGLNVGAPLSMTVAGFPARAVDLSRAGTAVGDSRIVDTARTTYFVFPPGTTGRLIELTVNGSPVVILYDAQAAAFASFSKIAQRVVASLQFPT